jgi:hypothetical protein
MFGRSKCLVIAIILLLIGQPQGKKRDEITSEYLRMSWRNSRYKIDKPP